jgi:hypothetical protein
MALEIIFSDVDLLKLLNQNTVESRGPQVSPSRIAADRRGSETLVESS